MAALSKVIVILSTGLSLTVMFFALRGAASEVRIRVRLEWARVAVGVGGVVIMGVIVGAHTPLVTAVIVIGGGGLAGFVQGQQIVVSQRETQLWAKRTVWGIILWSAGLIGMQLAGLGARTGVFRVGQAIALFSISVGLGVMAGRRAPEKAVRGSGGATAFALFVIGLLFVSVPDVADAQGEGPELLTGEVQVTLTWSGPADLDLYVVEPEGSEIYYGAPSGSQGGQLSVDSNAGCAVGSGSFVENIAWASGTPSGEFQIWVRNFSQCGDDQSGAQGFRVEIRAGGVVEVVDTGTLADQAVSNPVLIEVDNNNVPVPEIVSAEGGENLDRDPPQTGDGSRPTEVDEDGNPLNGSGSSNDGPDDEVITDEEAIGASIAAAFTALIMSGLTLTEAGQALTDMFGSAGQRYAGSQSDFGDPSADPPPPGGGTMSVEAANPDGTRTRIDVGPDGTETTTNYDRNGNVTSQSVTPPQQAGTSTISAANPDGSSTSVASHADGATTETRSAPDGSTTTVHRDPMGGVTSTSTTPPPTPGPGTPTETSDGPGYQPDRQETSNTVETSGTTQPSSLPSPPPPPTPAAGTPTDFSDGPGYQPDHQGTSSAAETGGDADTIGAGADGPPSSNTPGWFTQPAADTAPLDAEVDPTATTVPLDAEVDPTANTAPLDGPGTGTNTAPLDAEVDPTATTVPLDAEVDPTANTAPLDGPGTGTNTAPLDTPVDPGANTAPLDGPGTGTNTAPLDTPVDPGANTAPLDGPGTGTNTAPLDGPDSGTDTAPLDTTVGDAPLPDSANLPVGDAPRFSPPPGFLPSGHVVDATGAHIGYWDPTDIDANGRVTMVDLNGRSAVPAVDITGDRIIGVTAGPNADTYVGYDPMSPSGPRGVHSMEPGRTSVIGHDVDGQVIDADGNVMGQRIDDTGPNGEPRTTYVDVDGNPMTVVETTDGGRQIIDKPRQTVREPIRGVETSDGRLLDADGRPVGQRIPGQDAYGRDRYIDPDGNPITAQRPPGSTDPSARSIGAGPEVSVPVPGTGDGTFPQNQGPAEGAGNALPSARTQLTGGVRAEWDRVGAGLDGELYGPDGQQVGTIDNQGVMRTMDGRPLQGTRGGSPGQAPEFIHPDAENYGRDIAESDSRGNTITPTPSEDIIDRMMGEPDSSAPRGSTESSLPPPGRSGPPADPGSGTPGTEPGSTALDPTTIPDTTVPDGGAPTTIPDTTIPDTTVPDTTVPDTGPLDTGPSASTAATRLGAAVETAGNYHDNVTKHGMTPSEALGVGAAQTAAGNAAMDALPDSRFGGMTMTPSMVTNVGGSVAAGSLLPNGLDNLMPDRMAANTVRTAYQGTRAVFSGEEGAVSDFVDSVRKREGFDPFAGYVRGADYITGEDVNDATRTAGEWVDDNAAVANERATDFQQGIADGGKDSNAVLRGWDHIARGTSEAYQDPGRTAAGVGVDVGWIAGDVYHNPSEAISEAVDHFQTTSRQGDYGMITQGYSEMAHEFGAMVDSPSQYASDIAAVGGQLGHEFGQWIGW